MAYIFISYSHKDKDYAHKLHQHLFEHGFDVWIDDRIDYGSHWPYEIEKRLKECSVFVLIMSPDSYKSDWVQNELHLVRKLNKIIYTLLLEGDNWWHLQTVQYFDVRSKELPSTKFFVSLSNAVSQTKDKNSSNISIVNVAGNVQGNIVVGNDNNVRSIIDIEDEIAREKAENGEHDVVQKAAREKGKQEERERADHQTDRFATQKAEKEKRSKDHTELKKRERETKSIRNLYKVVAITLVTMIGLSFPVVKLFGAPATPIVPSPDLLAIRTSAAHTAVAELTLTAAAFTPTLLPPTGISTLKTPTSGTTQNIIVTSSTLCDDYIYWADVTIADGTTMPPGQEFVKTWKIKNTGICAWGNGYGLIYAGYADQMSGEPVPLDTLVEVGQEVDVSVNFKAPAKVGEYTSAWQMANAKGLPFGKTIFVKIIVK